MGSHCARLSTSQGRGHKSCMEKLAACVSQNSFSLSTEGQGQEQEKKRRGKRSPGRRASCCCWSPSSRRRVPGGRPCGPAEPRARADALLTHDPQPRPRKRCLPLFQRE
ncbi:Protamine-3 [Manis javanica]|nr:Protamine-3 [Manis javanica]